MSEYYKDANRYDDIINLPYRQSTEREHMSLHDRAAQFSPFAALTGYDEAIEETTRITEEKIILDENAIEKINQKIFDIANHLNDKINVSITYFKEDKRKSGGAYLTDIGTVKKIDENEKTIIMDSGIKIEIRQIIKIEPEEYS